MPELYHPDLDVTIVVDENKARNRRAAGWVDVDPTEYEVLGVYTDRPAGYVATKVDDPDPDDTVEDDD